jgi:hypothetical protein
MYPSRYAPGFGLLKLEKYIYMDLGVSATALAANLKPKPQTLNLTLAANLKPKSQTLNLTP